MKCPCCGATGVTLMSFTEVVSSQFWKITGLVACVAAAIGGQAELIGEPWRHVVSIVGTVAGTLVAWNIKQHPVKETDAAHLIGR